MQFITTDQRIAVENFEIGLIYTVTFTSGSYFLGACIGIGRDYVIFQRTAPELIFSLTMVTAADVASIEPLGSDIGKILEYTGSVPVSIKTNGSPLLAYTIKGNGLPGTGDKTANLFDKTDILSGYEIVNNQIFSNAEWGVSGYIPVEQGKYYIAAKTGSPVLEYETIGGTAVRSGKSITLGSYTPSETARFIRINFRLVNLDEVMLNTGSTALPFEPFGVKIPILSGDTTTNIYLDNPLRKSLDGTAVDELSSNGKLTQRVDTDGSVLSTPIISYIDIRTIPTTDGLNIFDIDTTVKPSEVYLKYFSPIF